MLLQSHHQYIDQTPRRKVSTFLCASNRHKEPVRLVSKRRAITSLYHKLIQTRRLALSIALLDPVSSCSKAILGTGLTINWGSLQHLFFFFFQQYCLTMNLYFVFSMKQNCRRSQQHKVVLLLFRRSVHTVVCSRNCHLFVKHGLKKGTFSQQVHAQYLTKLVYTQIHYTALKTSFTVKNTTKLKKRNKTD